MVLTKDKNVMLSDSKVIEFFYMADDFCNFFNETVKNIPLMTQRGIETNRVVFPIPRS